jgi:hypothetical protein
MMHLDMNTTINIELEYGAVEGGKITDYGVRRRKIQRYPIEYFKKVAVKILREKNDEKE